MGEAQPGCIDDPTSACHHDPGSHGPREVHDHQVSAPQPLTGDDLAVDHAARRGRYHGAIADALPFPVTPRESAQMVGAAMRVADSERAPLVAEVERLRAQVEKLRDLAADGPFYVVDFHGPVESVDVQELRRILNHP